MMDCYTAAILLALIQCNWSLALSAMVLPRPPSSPNYIQRFDRKSSEQKLYEDKSLQGFLPRPNAERTNTNDYSLVEIELQSPDEMDTSLQDIVHAMMKQSTQINSSYPNPEVIPHSIFGVRDVGLSNVKPNPAVEDRQVLSSPKYQNHDEKLYYLKSRPKVYVNVRGRSGSFRKEPKTTSYPLEYLRVTPSVRRQTDWRSKKIVKKFKHQTDEYKKLGRDGNDKKVNRLAVVYDIDDGSTTENSMVTSSELPKQIPAPPSRVQSRVMTQTTPVQRYALMRTNTLPGYAFLDV
ncbi:uncharacterized protein LOC108631168 [Ceratina calcarata]|uniref:Uncharacterized protein LOC108631168 n=1 Tax=Ceratina calcarata TaxID=156304 RepID=A0AAJ7NDW6_9HYME|nr:uncharacterized protein LOC108631168 [Ceratina calcarata]